MNETAEERRLRLNAYNRKRYQTLHPNFRKRRASPTPITKEFILDNIVIDTVTGCWNWQRSKSKGYGRIWDGKMFVQAHRIAYELWGKPIPKGMFGCHKCDNRACCNPDHIFPGYQVDNMRDCSSKGRVNGFKKKISDEQARAIMADIRPGIVVAKEYGVTDSLICHIRRGKRRFRS